MPLPGGPPPQCSDLDVHGEHVQSSRLQLGIGLGSLSSTLRFDGSEEVDVEMNTISLAGSWRLNESWSIRVGLGLITDGTLQPDNQAAYTIKPGGLMAVGIEHLYHLGEGYIPTLDYSVFLSAASTKIESPTTQNETSYFSSDFRVGGRASWNINGQVFPYFSGRVFGGPVSWELDGVEVIGSDIHHYQFALGTALQFGSLGTFAEWAGVGEKAMSLGFSYVW